MEGYTLKVKTMFRLDAFDIWWYRPTPSTKILDGESEQRRSLLKIAKRNQIIDYCLNKRKQLTLVTSRNTKYNLLQVIVEGNIEARREVGRG